jgi:predicted transcriptional regulator
MPPHHVLLLTEMAGVSAPSKLFFVKLVQRYAEQASFCFRVKLLAAELAVTDRVVTKALSELTARGFLIRSVGIKGRGRPTPTYLLGRAYEVAINAGKASHQLNQGELVDRVLKSSRGEVQDGLSTSNLLLLAVLLASANRVGVVVDVHRSTLCRLTGLTRSSIQRQLQRLHALKSIRAIVWGVMASDVLGSTPSTIFLNLQTPTPYAVGEPADIFVYTLRGNGSYVSSGFSSKSLAQRILEIGSKHRRGLRRERYRRTWSEAEGLLPDLVKIESVSTLLEENRAALEWVPTILQARIEQYASFLLSEHWGDLVGGTYKTDVKLISRIRMHLKGVNDGTDTAGLELALLLHDVSVLLAQWIQRLMNWVVGRPYELMKHVILPRRNDVNALYEWVVVSYGDSLVDTTGCYVLSYANGWDLVLRKFKDEVAWIEAG